MVAVWRSRPGKQTLAKCCVQDESSFLWVSEEHAKAENATTLSNPGPGAYDDLNLDCVKLRHPVTAFPKVVWAHTQPSKINGLN